MASNEVTVTLEAKDLIKELKKAQEILSEERIRKIVREEIRSCLRNAMYTQRANGNNLPSIMPLSMETK